MARGNTVELVFAGDSQQLEKTFQRVGSGAQDMSSKIDRASRDAKSGFDKLGDGADVGEQRIVGLRDAITGTGDVMRGFKEGDVTLLLTGFADMASSIANFAVPVLGKLAAKLGLTTIATNVMSVAQGALSAVMALNPITLVVIALAALVAGFVLAWKHSETFRNIVRGALDVVGNAVGWVVDRFKGLWEFIKDLPGLIGGIGKKILEVLTWPYRTAFNQIAKLWNNSIGRISFEVPSWVPAIGGKGFSFPKLPEFHQGGIVPGLPGSEMLAVLQAGERVIPAGGAGGTTVVVNVQGHVLDGRQLGELVHTALLGRQRRTGALGI